MNTLQIGTGDTLTASRLYDTAEISITQVSGQSAYGDDPAPQASMLLNKDEALALAKWLVEAFT